MTEQCADWRYALDAVVVDVESVVAGRVGADDGGLGEALRRARADGRRVVGFGAGADALNLDVRIPSSKGADAGSLAVIVRRAAIAAERAVLVTGDPQAVAAGREAGFGAVVGLARERGAARLRGAGADLVVADLRGLDRRALRRREPRPVGDVSRALDDLDGLVERLCRRGRPAVFLDYDGTLTPIVSHPDAAVLDDAMREAISVLAAAVPVAIVSGRDRADVEGRVGLSGLYYAGGHGFDIAGPDRRLEHPGGIAALPSLDAAEATLRQALAHVPGARVERKRCSIAVHYRHVAPERVDEVFASARAATPPDLKRSEGKKVVELGPRVDWHKGRAVTWLLEALKLDRADVIPVFFGDDRTDENAFLSLGGDGVGILVGAPEYPETFADLRVADDGEVAAILRHLSSHVASIPTV